MTVEQIKELIEVTKMLSYLDGFIDGHGGEEPHDVFPFDCKCINEVHDLQEKTKQYHDKLILKFNNGNINANK
jgi:hypothetical protein